MEGLNKIRRRLKLGFREGYTLVEMIVVMGITGILLSLTFLSYTVLRSQKYIEHSTNVLQESIGESFIDVISTENDVTTGDCNGKAPAFKGVKIGMDTGAEISSKVAYITFCEADDGTGLTSDTSKNIDFSDKSYNINHRELVKIAYNKDNPDNFQADGSIYIIFDAPFGNYHSFWVDGLDSDDKLTSELRGDPMAACGGQPCWEKDPKQHYYRPTLDNNGGLGERLKNFKLKVGACDSALPGVCPNKNEKTLIISDSGNVEMK